jgi:hypothetical protein
MQGGVPVATLKTLGTDEEQKSWLAITRRSLLATPTLDPSAQSLALHGEQMFPAEKFRGLSGRSRLLLGRPVRPSCLTHAGTVLLEHADHVAWRLQPGLGDDHPDSLLSAGRHAATASDARS